MKTDIEALKEYYQELETKLSKETNRTKQIAIMDKQIAVQKCIQIILKNQMPFKSLNCSE